MVSTTRMVLVVAAAAATEAVDLAQYALTNVSFGYPAIRTAKNVKDMCINTI